MFRLVAKNFSILTAGQVAGAAIAIVWVAFAARMLGPTQFGTFVLIGAYVRLVSFTMNSGLGPIAFRELARLRGDPQGLRILFEDVVSMRLALGVVGYVGLLAALYCLNEDRELLILVAISAITLLLDGINESYAAYYTAHERVTVPTAVWVGSSAASAVIGVAVLLDGFGLRALIVSEVLISLAFTVGWTLGFRSRIMRFALSVRFAAWRRLIMLALPFAPIHICNQASRVLNVVLLGRVQGPLPQEQSVGYYSPAQAVSNAAVQLVVSLRRLLIPPVTQRLAQGKTVTSELDVAAKLMMTFFALPLLLATSYMAPQIVTLLFGKSYEPSAMVLVLLGWAGALQVAAIAPEAFLFSHAEHRSAQYIGGALASLLVNITVCIVLIPDYGALGAAAGAVFGRAVYLLYLGHYCRRALGSQALHLHRFGDWTALLVASFAVWHMAFAFVPSPWGACAVAVILTIPFVGFFLLRLRTRFLAASSA